MDDIPHADETRTLIKDIWDLRIAKLRSSIDTFVKSDATHAKVNFDVALLFLSHLSMCSGRVARIVQTPRSRSHILNHINETTR